VSCCDELREVVLEEHGVGVVDARVVRIERQS